MTESAMLWFHWLISTKSSPIRYFFIPVTKTACCFKCRYLQFFFQFWPHSLLHHGTLTVLFYIPHKCSFFSKNAEDNFRFHVSPAWKVQHHFVCKRKADQNNLRNKALFFCFPAGTISEIHSLIPLSKKSIDITKKSIQSMHFNLRSEEFEKSTRWSFAWYILGWLSNLSFYF